MLLCKLCNIVNFNTFVALFNPTNCVTMQQKNISASEENAYQQEWAYVKGRMFTLNLLAIGSLVVTFRLGGFIGNMVSDNSTTVFFIRAIFMWLAYMAIDWVLKNSLAAASNVGKDEQNSPTPKSVIRFAGAALLTTLGLSLASNLLLAQNSQETVICQNLTKK